jgi:hypothetical protein
MIQLHLASQLGDGDPRVLADELDGLVGPPSATAASRVPSGPSRAAAAPAAEACDRLLDLLKLVPQLAATLFEKRTRSVYCVTRHLEVLPLSVKCHFNVTVSFQGNG